MEHRQPVRGPTTHAIAPTTVGGLSRSPSAQRAFAVALGPLGYALAWTSIYAFHAGCALYCFAAAKLFRALQNTPTINAFDAAGRILRPVYFPTVALVHSVVGAVHVCFVAWPLVKAVYRLVTDRYHKGPSRTDSVLPGRFRSRLQSVQLPQNIERYIPVALRHTAKIIYARVFARHGLLGIESRQFDSLMLVRGVIESALKTYQAYQMCQALPRRGLNRLYVAMLVTNCWTTPLLHHVVKHRPLQRLLDRLCDVALDFLAAVGVPVILVASYWPQYSTQDGGFPFSCWNDALWKVTILSESPLVFFGSWVDALSRLVFSVGLLLSLDDIKFLLVRRRTSLAAVKPLRSVQAAKSESHTGWAQRALRLGHGLLFVFGLAVLTVHLHSELRERPTSCVFELDPWFVAKPTCVIVELNCYTDRALTGDANDFDSVFDNLTPTRLKRASFRHCHAIDVQPSIRQFSNLEVLKFYNSTVREWHTDASLANATNPHLTALNFIRTRFSNGTIPDGLLSRDFPRGVIDMVFSLTNLAQIPDQVAESWPPGLSLCLELSPLAYFPLAFTRIQAVVVTLVGNEISEIPPDAFQVYDQATLQLSGNPITLLPDEVAFDSGVLMILLDSTNLSTVPTWLLDAAAMGIYVAAGRTPYCDRFATAPTIASSEGSAGSLTMAPPEVSSWPIDCTDLGSQLGVYDERVDVRPREVW